MAEHIDITYVNRQDCSLNRENVYGVGVLEFLYGSRLGKCLLPIMVQHFSSRLFSRKYDKPGSVALIDDFSEKYGIDHAQFVSPVTGESGSYISFNDFFARKYKPGQWTFSGNGLSAFAEGRYLAYERIDQCSNFMIKGNTVDYTRILPSRMHATYHNGPIIIARLAPVDYHRFHFPIDGQVCTEQRIPGILHSVNPFAMQRHTHIHMLNERHVTELDTSAFGKLAMVEVGAFAVGKIQQTYPGSAFRKGDEKGYFMFGGSTVILIGQRNMWTPSTDLLQHSQEGLETFVRIGEEVGSTCL